MPLRDPPDEDIRRLKDDIKVQAEEIQRLTAENQALRVRQWAKLPLMRHVDSRHPPLFTVVPLMCRCASLLLRLPPVPLRELPRV